MGGKIYTPLGSWYHATKHALEGWSDCLRLELAQFGIDAIIIEPGIIKTEFGSVVVGPMMKRSILPTTRHLGSPVTWSAATSNRRALFIVFGTGL